MSIASVLTPTLAGLRAGDLGAAAGGIRGLLRLIGCALRRLRLLIDVGDRAFVLARPLLRLLDRLCQRVDLLVRLPRRAF